MKLITEHNDKNIQCIIEKADDGKRKFIIDGIFMEAEKVNRNKRLYEKEVLVNAVDKFITEYVDKGRAVGELNHPDGPTINLDKVSHRITNLNWKGNSCYGKALILDTPMGQIVKGLLEGGCQLGVSSRGMGSVTTNKDGHSIVNKDFVLSTIDIVQDPSAPNAFVNGIMEGKEWFMDEHGHLNEFCDNIKKTIHNTHISRLEEAKLEEFQKLLNGIRL